MITDNIAGVVGNVVAAIFVAVAISTLQSCEPDSWDKVYEPEEQVLQAGNTEYVVNVTGMTEEEHGTRSVLGAETEETPFIKDSGYQVFAFNRRTGVLEAMELVDSHSSSATLSLSAVDTYDFFVVGNLWFLDENGNKAGWDSFFTETDKYPAKAEDMTDASLMPYYRFDGASIGGTGLRTETFAEVAEYGIPFSGRVEGVNYQNSRNGISVSVRRLFSKVTLTVDHSGLVNSEIEEAFVNRSIHLRQVNCRIHPFIEGLAAVAEDILESAEDYESNPVNGMSETFVFYVPENCGGTYPVSDPSQKEPSAAGNRSGCVTYLEFVGELDPVKAGGYGGTLKYQFCLGGNATTDYNVIRNSNYKVELGFRAGSLFDSASWKLDMGSGLTDNRVLGLSADAAGNKRLKEDGTQVVAVRPANGASNKKEMYVFFNHKGEDSNEAASYIDEYSSGYTPADATRSALQISCPDMSADVIKYSYDKSTGKISFWTDSPTALTPGHEYTVTFRLHPGDKTVSAKIKTVANMEVSFNSENMLVGMKRSLISSGFCGGNVTLKVTSGGEDVLRYSNSAAADGSAGTDKYVTKTGVTLTGLSAPLYAYKNGSVTLSVSSDDTFNDEAVPITVNVGKPYPCYDDIKENMPMWSSQTESVVYGHAIVLPFDGTPVDVPAYYTTNGFSANKITVGPGENQFDPEVYAQLLDFVFTFTSDFVAKDPNTLKIYLQKWMAGSGSYFETNVLYNDFLMYPDILQKVFNNRVKLTPRCTAVFSGSNDTFETYLTTLIPGFYDVTQRDEGGYRGFKRTAWEKSEIESDYFNFWKSDWSAWTTLDEVQPDAIRAQWPKITNSIGFYLAGCSPSSITITREGDQNEDHEEEIYVVKEFLSTELEGEGDAVTLKWKYAPGEYDNGIAYTEGWAAPYGKQKMKLKITNIHNGEVFPPEDGSYFSADLAPESPKFSIKYGNVNLMSYLYCQDNSVNAELNIGAPSVLAARLYIRKTSNPYGRIVAPLDAYIGEGITYSQLPTDVYPGDLYYSSTVSFTAMYPAWMRDDCRFDPSHYSEDKWDADLAAYSFSNYCQSIVHAFKEFGKTTYYYSVIDDWYRNEDIKNYVTVSIGSQTEPLGYILY